MVLQTVMEKRTPSCSHLETMEASVGSYTASLSHNIDVDVETKETLQERHTQIVEEVEVLNAAYLESKEMVEKLSQTVSTGCGVTRRFTRWKSCSGRRSWEFAI